MCIDYNMKIYSKFEFQIQITKLIVLIVTGHTTWFLAQFVVFKFFRSVTLVLDIK